MQRVFFSEGVPREIPEVGFSEAAMHMGIAGRRDMAAKLVGPRQRRMVQLYDAQGKEFSFPITAGEAGLYYDEAGHVYAYVQDDLAPKRS